MAITVAMAISEMFFGPNPVTPTAGCHVALGTFEPQRLAAVFFFKISTTHGALKMDKESRFRKP